MRTTIDVDDDILGEVEAIREKEGRPIGAIVSELLAEALANRRRERCGLPLRWSARPMKALIDLANKEAVRDTSL